MNAPKLALVKALSAYDQSLIAHPVNSELSTEPNKSQTIINILRAEGPMSKNDLIERMQGLLGSERAAKYKILSLVQQLEYADRLEWDDESGLLKVMR